MTLISNVIELFDIHDPVKTVNFYKPKFLWTTDTARKMMALRGKTLKRFRRSKNQAHEKYRQLSNTNNRTIKRKKIILEFRTRTLSPKISGRM